MYKYCQIFLVFGIILRRVGKNKPSMNLHYILSTTYVRIMKADVVQATAQLVF